MSRQSTTGPRKEGTKKCVTMPEFSSLAEGSFLSHFGSIGCPTLPTQEESQPLLGSSVGRGLSGIQGEEGDGVWTPKVPRSKKTLTKKAKLEEQKH